MSVFVAGSVCGRRQCRASYAEELAHLLARVPFVPQIVGELRRPISKTFLVSRSRMEDAERPLHPGTLEEILGCHLSGSPERPLRRVAEESAWP